MAGDGLQVPVFVSQIPEKNSKIQTLIDKRNQQQLHWIHTHSRCDTYTLSMCYLYLLQTLVNTTPTHTPQQCGGLLLSVFTQLSPGFPAHVTHLTSLLEGSVKESPPHTHTHQSTGTHSSLVIMRSPGQTWDADYRVTAKPDGSGEFRWAPPVWRCVLYRTGCLAQG